jgi:hypothetical protein
VDDAERARLQRWWEIYAGRLESDLEKESKKRLDNDSLLYALLIASVLAITVVGIAEDGADDGWASILIWVVGAWFLLGALLIPVALLKWVIEGVLRRRRDAEFVEMVEESRLWAYSSLGYGPSSIRASARNEEDAP